MARVFNYMKLIFINKKGHFGDFSMYERRQGKNLATLLQPSPVTKTFLFLLPLTSSSSSLASTTAKTKQP
jgi:hypothetical protein